MHICVWGQIEDKNEVVAVYPLNAEFTKPFWVFGISSYDFVKKDGDNHKIVCTYRLCRKIIQSFFQYSACYRMFLMQSTVNVFNGLFWDLSFCRQNGRSCLGILDYIQGSFLLLETPFTDINNIVCPLVLNYSFLVAKLLNLVH